MQLVKDITIEATESGDYAIVVLDIRNAFNSIPWPIIRRTLRHKDYSEYIRRLIDSYLSDRVINYVIEKTVWKTHGSRSSKVRWYLVHVVKYCVRQCSRAGREWRTLQYCLLRVWYTCNCNWSKLLHTRWRASVFIGRVINIRRLGLTVAIDKTEAIIFSKKSNELLSGFAINDVLIDFVLVMKYLGVMINADWSFRNHFKYVEDKVGVILILNRLMPNLRGPNEKRRRLHANVVFSIILYGAPVWRNVLIPSRLRSVFACFRTFYCTKSDFGINSFQLNPNIDENASSSLYGLDEETRSLAPQGVQRNRRILDGDEECYQGCRIWKDASYGDNHSLRRRSHSLHCLFYRFSIENCQNIHDPSLTALSETIFSQNHGLLSMHLI